MSTCKFGANPNLDIYLTQWHDFTRTDVESDDPQDDAQFAIGAYGATAIIDLINPSSNITSITVQICGWNGKHHTWQLGKTITFNPASWTRMKEDTQGGIIGFKVIGIAKSDSNPASATFSVALANRLVGGN